MKIFLSFILLAICQLSYSGDFIGLDIRSSAELERNPAPGAIHLTVRDLDQAPRKLDKNMTIKVFCESGIRAERAKRKLEKMGFKNVENISSWRDWNELQRKK
jgi:phage shock protein E